jgi:hypothetical protein
MARPKKGAGPSKADAIREALKNHPRARTSEIVRMLADKGIKVLSNHVYAIKAHARKKKGRMKRAEARVAAHEAGITNPVQAVTEVRNLAVKLGGMSQLKKLVDLLAER